MPDRLDRLAESHGIQTRYVSELGEETAISTDAKETLLSILGVDPGSGELGDFELSRHHARQSCVAPEGARRWGVACQLYALRSARSLGLGDFEDLALLCEIAAQAGAQFVGVNPLHALFLADPGRFSPYSPSTRRFLNPFYIAVDALDGGPEAIDALRRSEPGLFETLDGDLVDYPAAGALKKRLLVELFEATRRGDPAFRAYVKEGGAALADFALFEAISEHMVATGHGAGWHGWPESWHDRASPAVLAFERESTDQVRFHQWLQFVADRQLADAQGRAKAAGMSIGLYLDFAVGVAPDGAETWIDPALTVPDARVGSPPDMFNSDGQDWGLAPLSPAVLEERGYEPLAQAYEAMMRHAGAVRIDHAMGLARLWWIADGDKGRVGGYVRTPLGSMIDTVAKVSRANGTIVIGEDLGTVPEGFRPAMERANILSYRVLYFERRDDDGFVPPERYPELSLACISTHDLATLAGWWTGADIDLRASTGRQDEAAGARDRRARDGDRTALVKALKQAGLSPEEAGEEYGEDVAIAVHRFAARTKSALFAVQLDDLIGSERQANLPGTTDEYPNWRVRSPVALEDLAAHPLFQRIARAVREERPEPAR